MKKFYLLLFISIITNFSIAQTVSKTINVNTPGSLSTFFTLTETTSVTNLTISGNIDARDFVFMRDKMTKLSALNLSSAKIKRYSGVNGTYSGLSLFYPLNELPMYAFYNANTLTNNQTLTNITLPNTITSIGYLAFYNCENINGTFTIPTTVKSIGDYALYGCKSITAYSVNSGNTRYSADNGILMSAAQDSIFICPISKSGTLNIPYTVKWIGPSAFESCSLLTGVLTLPASLTTIEDFAFYYCSGFTGKLTIPSLVSKIGNSSFYGCSGLNENLILPKNLNSLHKSSFFLCDNLQAIEVNALNSKLSSVNGVLYSKDADTLLIYPGGKSGSVSLASTLKVIAPYAMYNCKNITGSISISETVDSIGEYAFFGCNQISDFNVNINNNKFSSDLGVLFSKNKTKLIACPATMSTEYSIPNTVQTIEAGAFTNCTLLTGKIRIPASVINIGSYAFYGCSSISGFEVDENNQYFSSLDGLLFNRSQDSLYICPLSKSGKYEVPNTVSYIGYSAFDGCTSLSEIVVPASVKTIDNYAFEYCSGLLKVQIAENIDSIGTAAFYYCTNLNTFEIKQPIPPAIDYYTFDGVDQSTCSLVVPTGSATIYQSAKFWKDFTNLSESDFANNIANIDYSKLKISCNNKHVTVSEITIGEKLSLYDIQGKKIFEITPKQNTIMFNLTHNGIYILKTKSASYKLSI